MYLPLVVALLGSAVWARSTERIIGGTECDPHSQPWQVALYNYDRYICGGVLISESWVLSAAHCCCGNIQMRLGAHNRTNIDDAVQFSYADKIFSHCGFNPTTYENDIMLLKLPTPVSINDYVKPVPLPSNLVDVGTSCGISGWGTTTSPNETYPDLLQCAYVKIVSASYCQESYPKDVITDSMLCAGVEEGGIDTCQGDSGGPLICNSELQGITSWGEIPCAQANKPGIYTKIINYLSWINNIMENQAECVLNPPFNCCLSLIPFNTAILPI